MDLTDEALKILEQAYARVAIERFSRKSITSAELEKVMEKIWAEAVHELLLYIPDSCPCQKNMPEKCFLKLDPIKQQSYFIDGGALSYKEFKRQNLTEKIAQTKTSSDN